MTSRALRALVRLVAVVVVLAAVLLTGVGSLVLRVLLTDAASRTGPGEAT